MSGQLVLEHGQLLRRWLGAATATTASPLTAAAEHGGLAVLHRDAHFDRLGEVLGFQSVELPGP